MKRKTIVVLSFIVLLLGLSLFLLSNKIRKTQEQKENYLSIPSFQTPDINGHIVTEVSLSDYQTVMFLYFNPDCSLCKEEMIHIKENESALRRGKIVFFSGLPADSIKQFLLTIGFEPTPNMLFLSDEKAIMINKMDVKGAPTVYIYRQGQLFKRFDGPVKIETLIRYLSE